MPALRMGSATCATALATSRHVETTPTTGANGKIALTTLGKNLFNVMPTAMGARTTFYAYIYDSRCMCRSCRDIVRRGFHRKRMCKVGGREMHASKRQSR